MADALVPAIHSDRLAFEARAGAAGDTVHPSISREEFAFRNVCKQPDGSKARKILIYTHALAGGGAERVCAILASGFARRGYDVIMAVDAVDPDNAPFLDPRVRTAVLGRNHLRGTLALAALLRREQPDASLSAIGVSNLKHSMAAGLAGRLRHAVLSVHAFAVSEPQLLSRIAYKATPLLSRLAARTVAVSESLREDLVRSWYASPQRTVAIHNPIVTGPDLTRLPRPPGERPFVLAAGRLTPGKDMRGLVRTFAQVAARRDVELVILGEGPERGLLEADIAALGLTGRVSLPGYVPEPWDFYRRAACFVSASPTESFSMVIAEALSYGLPVVSVEAAGPREILKDGAFGRLVASEDPTALATSIVAALDQPVDDIVRRQRGQSFSIDTGLDAYERLFEPLMRAA